MKLYEDLRENDLANLISSYISIDEYTSKIDEDNITVALFVNELDAAEELEDFIENIIILKFVILKFLIH